MKIRRSFQKRKIEFVFNASIHSSERPLRGSERSNNISSETPIVSDYKEDIISSAAPRTSATADISVFRNNNRKIEPRKLGEVRFKDMC